MTPWRTWRTRLILFFAVLGPGFITANVDNDAGGILTYSAAGAQYGYTLLWTMLPPPDGWTDANRNVSFVGTPYDDRADTLTRLSALNEFGVVISGNRRSWERALTPHAFTALYREGELYQQQYREAIWRSKINLSFITRSNQDEFVHKSFEIAGCGGFLLAERSEGHLQRFREDEEAVFFSTFDELLQKIRRYLPDEAARQRIAAAGHARAVRDGYHNDHQVSLIADRVQQLLPTLKNARPTPP